MSMPLEFERPLVELEQRIEELRRRSGKVDLSREIDELVAKAARLQERIYRGLTPWQTVQLARHPRRPYTQDYIDRLVDEFVELHGDRRFGEDPAIIAGFGRIAGRSCLIAGHQKGRNTTENVLRNFGMPRPEGYRKVQRLLALAERFSRPVVTFIDTAGAYPGLGAEERGQAEAIATSLLQMAAARVPIVACITGEGGSGGALAMGVADRVLVMQYSIYSVISPEGCATILFHDAGRASEAAESLKLTAPHLLALGVIDEIVPEPAGGAHRHPDAAAAALGEAIGRCLDELQDASGDELVASRSRRFRRMGVFLEDVGDPGARKAAKADAKHRDQVYKAAIERLATGRSATAELLDGCR